MTTNPETGSQLVNGESAAGQISRPRDSVTGGHDVAAGRIDGAAPAEGFRTRIKIKATAQDSSKPAPPAAAERRDDLTRIIGLSPAHQAALYVLGYSTYDAISAWRRADVLNVRRALSLGRTISQQNWIEQAALLTLRLGGAPATARIVWNDLVLAAPVAMPADDGPVTTVFAHPPCDMPALPATMNEPVAEVPTQRMAAATWQPASPYDRLDLIRGMDCASEALLASAGVRRASDIARWTSQDVMRWSHRLGAGKRISANGWIEQATLLAAGMPTAHAQIQAEMVPAELVPSSLSLEPAAWPAPDVPLLCARLAAGVVAAESAPPAKIAAVERALVDAPPALAVLSRHKAAAPKLDIAISRPPLFTLPPLPLGPRPDPPAPARPAEQPLQPVSEPVPPGVEATWDSAAPIHAGETIDIVIVTHDKLERTRPLSLVPKRARPDTDATSGDRRTGRLTQRIERLEQARLSPAGRNGGGYTPARSEITAADAKATPLDLSTLDDLEAGFPALSAGEADVVIVKSPAASNDFSGARVRVPDRGSSTAKGRRSCGIDDPNDHVDAASYAAYRDAVEEANVEIVRMPKPKTGAGDTPDVPGAHPRAGSITRFFNALARDAADRQPK